MTLLSIGKPIIILISRIAKSNIDDYCPLTNHGNKTVYVNIF